jgi:hypothetical protein
MTVLVLICVLLFRRTVGVTTFALALSPSACALFAAAARSCVCHSCSVFVALAFAPGSGTA